MLCSVTINKIWRFCCSKELHLQLENSSNLDPREIERAKKGQVGCALVVLLVKFPTIIVTMLPSRVSLNVSTL